MKNGKPKHPLAKIRERNGLTQNQLGILVGQSGNRIALFEGGFQYVPFSVFYKLSEHFDIQPEEFEQEITNYTIAYQEWIVENMKSRTLDQDRA